MLRIFRFSLLLLLLLPGSCEDESNESTGSQRGDHQSVLLISLDGFAFDYRGKAFTPALDSMVNNGATAQALIPVFPSKTFPNHYTQVTGLYPEDHGIIGNRMYDPEFNEYFSLTEPSVRDGKWYGGEPIWVTCQRQGLTSATMFWPGSDAEIAGSRPDDYFVFNGAVTYQARVQQVLDWMERDMARPHFISLYFEAVDQAGHGNGPDHPQVIEAIEAMDALLNELFQGIVNLGLQEFINIIIVSDHGMTEIGRERVIFLDDYLDLNQVEVVNWSPLLELIPLTGEEESVYQSLAGQHPNWQVFRKQDLPEHWHYQDHKRVTPVLALADLDWSISSRSFFQSTPGAFEGGNHGYDPQEAAMGGIFMASGPGFRQGVEIEAVENVHLYELMCFLLDIEPALNDGDLTVWEDVLNP